MLTNLHIEHFQGFKNLKIDSLKRVNLICGQNNTGKTGVLEALALLLWEKHPGNCPLPNLFRTTNDASYENFWKWLFYKNNTERPVKIKVDAQNAFSRELLIHVSSHPHLENYGKATTKGQALAGDKSIYFTIPERPGNQDELKFKQFSTHPIDPKQDAIDYNRVVLKRRKKAVADLLKKIEPRLESIETLQTGSAPLLYADIGLNEMIPVTQLGQGFNRLLGIYSEIMAAEATVLLVDEIENGLHHSVLPTIWQGLFNAAREMDIQVFATTHSWECVLAADQAARQHADYDLNLIRLDRVKEDIKATLISKETLDTAKELQWEMR